MSLCSLASCVCFVSLAAKIITFHLTFCHCVLNYNRASSSARVTDILLPFLTSTLSFPVRKQVGSREERKRGKLRAV